MVVRFRKRAAALLVLGGGVVLTASGCAPRVGSDLWCYNMTNKSVGEWTGNEAVDFTKHCVIKRGYEQIKREVDRAVDDAVGGQ